MWKELVDDASVQKMHLPGDAQRVPVMKAPETIFERERRQEKRVLVRSNLETQSSTDDALGQVAKVGSGVSSLSSPLFGEVGQAFRGIHPQRQCVGPRWHRGPGRRGARVPGRRARQRAPGRPYAARP